LQPAAALAKLHTVEQELQWLGSEVRLTSHPSPMSALQLAKPVLQPFAAIEHVPPEQTPSALAGAQA